MKCYHCNTELRWDSDIDFDNDIYNIISTANLGSDWMDV